MDREAALASLGESLRRIAGDRDSLQVQGVDLEGSGVNKTANWVLKRHIQPLLAASTVEELVDASDRCQAGLMATGVFSDVSLALDNNMVVHIGLPAAKRFVARTGTSFGNSEGSGYFRGTVRNMLGWAETVNLDTSIGTRTRSSHLLDMSVPVLLGWKAELLGYASEKVVDWASHQAQVRGITMRMVHSHYSFGMDAVLRSLYATKLRPSDSVRQFAGHAFKLSAFHNWTVWDTRNHNLLPTAGSILRFHSEAVAGDHPYLKTQGWFHRGFRLFKNITATSSAQAGILYPLSQRGSHIMDRFTLGGPLDIRGFRLNSLGPQDLQDFIGGNSLLSAGLSIYGPLPRVKSDALKLHGFCNAGTLGGLTPSASSGFGIVYARPDVRFELNLAMPLVLHQGEGAHKGIQFGVGLEFL